ncbi:hypothetical protein M3Y98_00302400 [Aphelenchoides besseyi]|nr:hypothetical protein M3Y98_00302400 [Aphelenchoides besseyi]KAI6201241.1 hypothetical protein M3Y96_00820700 [Aphelenchoides besseyi]
MTASSVANAVSPIYCYNIKNNQPLKQPLYLNEFNGQLKRAHQLDNNDNLDKSQRVESISNAFKETSQRLFDVTSTTAKLDLSQESKSRRQTQRNWSITKLYNIKDGRVEKIRTEDQIEREKKLRKIRPIKTKVPTYIDPEVSEWRLMVQEHECVWQKVVLRYQWEPEFDVRFSEEDEQIIEPVSFFSEEEEDCF